MNINEKGVAPHGCAHTAEQKRGAQEHLHVFHKIPPSVFLVFHVDFIFFFFFSTILPSRHGMGIMGLQMRFFFACGALAENAYGMRIEIMVFLLCDV